MQLSIREGQEFSRTNKPVPVEGGRPGERVLKSFTGGTSFADFLKQRLGGLQEDFTVATSRPELAGVPTSLSQLTSQAEQIRRRELQENIAAQKQAEAEAEREQQRTEAESERQLDVQRRKRQANVRAGFSTFIASRA